MPRKISISTVDDNSPKKSKSGGATVTKTVEKELTIKFTRAIIAELYLPLSTFLKEEKDCNLGLEEFSALFGVPKKTARANKTTRVRLSKDEEPPKGTCEEVGVRGEYADKYCGNPAKNEINGKFYCGTHFSVTNKKKSKTKTTKKSKISETAPPDESAEDIEGLPREIDDNIVVGIGKHKFIVSVGDDDDDEYTLVGIVEGDDNEGEIVKELTKKQIDIARENGFKVGKDIISNMKVGKSKKTGIKTIGEDNDLEKSPELKNPKKSKKMDPKEDKVIEKSLEPKKTKKTELVEDEEDEIPGEESINLD
jgi:hypothetical protein